MNDSPFSNFSFAFGQVFSSFSRVSRACGWIYWVIVALALLLFFGGLSISSALSGTVRDVLLGWLTATATPEWMPSWVISVAGVMSSVIVWIAVMFLICLIGGAVILVVLSPLLSHVTNRVWVELGHPEPHDSIASTIGSIFRGIVVAIKYLCCQIVGLLLVFIISFIPVIGFVAPLLYLIVNAFFYGASFADYALERSGRSAGDAFEFSFKNKTILVGLGLPFAIAMLIPLIGSYLALFIAPASAAAGAAVVNNEAVQTKIHLNQ